jgi:hypothetical protein
VIGQLGGVAESITHVVATCSLTSMSSDCGLIQAHKQSNAIRVLHAR